MGTPIGNLKDISLRALDVFREVDVIYCEDTRRTVKLLNAYEIKKPLKSAPYFKEREASAKILERLKSGESVAYATDAGMPSVSDPGSIVVSEAREAGYAVEIIGGVSSLTHFLAGMGHELESFIFVGFLPHKSTQKLKLFQSENDRPLIFFDSPHRIEKTLKLVEENFHDRQMILAKELTKRSEAFFQGRAGEILQKVPSWKGEWLGLIWPHVDAGDSGTQ